MESDTNPSGTVETTTFQSFQLSEPLNRAIDELGFKNCTPIQSQAIGPILEGKDLAGLAQTGTGKTAAYLVPLIERILRSQGPVEGERHPRAFPDWHPRNFILVLVPTRELAEQVGENFQSLSKHTSLRSVSIYGGVGYEPQKKGLAEGVEFVFATPGRFIDLYKEHVVDLKQVRAIVFDEADRMFDMGFKDDMKYILQRTPRERQFLMFSATLNLDVLNVAYQYGAQPVEVSLSRDEARAENVKDYICHVGHDEKPAYLLSVLKKEKPRQAIVFSNFKNNIGRISTFLQKNGWDSLGISSLLSQAQRQRVMEKFKSPDSSYVMVATDVAARGLDIKGVDLVINFDLPDDAENYVHRIGRTGRASAQGRAVSLVSDRDVDALTRIDEYLGKKIEVMWLEDHEIVTDFAPFPPREFEARGAGRYRDGGARSGQGRGDSGSRKCSSRPQRQGGPRPDKQRSESARPEKSQSREQHRDRRTGRHKEQRDQQSARPTGSQQQKPRPQHQQGSGQNKKKSTRRRQRSQHQRANGRDQRAVQSQAPKGGIVSKVTGVFKKLFGGGKEQPRG